MDDEVADDCDNNVSNDPRPHDKIVSNNSHDKIVSNDSHDNDNTYHQYKNKKSSTNSNSHQSHGPKQFVKSFPNPNTDPNNDHSIAHSNNENENESQSLYVPPNTSDFWSSSNNRRRKNKYEKYNNNRDRGDKGDIGGDRDRDRNRDMNMDMEVNDENEKRDYPMLDYYDPMKKLPGDDLKLNSSWNVWIHENSNDDWSLESYQSIFTIDSVGSMWRFLSVFDNLDKNARQYYIMRDGITPIWEDNNNKHGAICSIMIDNVIKSNRFSKGDLGVDAFSSICILVMNESFVRKNQDINGLCYSIKSRSALIKLWVKDYELNKKYGEKLPITILKSFDSMVSNMEGRGAAIGGKSRISVQTKQIKPNY